MDITKKNFENILQQYNELNSKNKLDNKSDNLNLLAFSLLIEILNKQYLSINKKDLKMQYNNIIIQKHNNLII